MLKPQAKRASDGREYTGSTVAQLVLGALAIFLYVGGEVSIGSFLVNYFSESSIAGMSASMLVRWSPTTGVQRWWAALWVPLLMNYVCCHQISRR